MQMQANSYSSNPNRAALNDVAVFKVCQAKSIFLSFDMNYDDRPNDKSAAGHGTSHQAAHAQLLVHPKKCCCVR